LVVQRGKLVAAGVAFAKVGDIDFALEGPVVG